MTTYIEEKEISSDNGCQTTEVGDLKGSANQDETGQPIEPGNIDERSDLRVP